MTMYTPYWTVIVLASTRRYAVIPTHNRPSELRRLANSLASVVDNIIIIDNASTPKVTLDDIIVATGWPKCVDYIEIIYDGEQPPNLYRIWNVGLNAVQKHVHDLGHETWDVAIFNDDAIVPDGWFDAVTCGLRQHNVALASTGAHHEVTQDELLAPGTGMRYRTRVCPWAFVMRGELGIRADERFRWWYGDNDIIQQAREHSGVAVVRGPVVANEHANSTTIGVLAEQSVRDGQTFKEKWEYAR